jgi:phosphoglucosamine mutase
MLFGSSGIRRKYGPELVDIALAIGPALGRRGGVSLIGRDTRTTGPVLNRLISAGIIAAGGQVRDTGVVPTPAVAYGTREVTTGVMITASHNPEEYNGIKLFNPDGSSFSGDQQLQIEDNLGRKEWMTWDGQGEVREVDALSPYIRAISGKRSSLEGLPLILDCGNGAGSVASPVLLSDLGADLSCVNCNPSGYFARQSEPLEEYLGYIGDLVRKWGAAGAVVHDGDADRMMAFDSRGRYISGDHLLMLFAKYLDAREVVTTVDASMAIEEIATVRRTPVGDTAVSAELARWGTFGGEPSGAWIFPEHSLCPDGPYAAALYGEIACEWDIAAEIDGMPAYPVLRESLPCDEAPEVMRSIGAESPTDGIRIAGEDGWCLIRASGTEPKIRLTAEGTDRRAAETMLTKGRALLKSRKSA